MSTGRVPAGYVAAHLQVLVSYRDVTRSQELLQSTGLQERILP